MPNAQPLLLLCVLVLTLVASCFGFYQKDVAHFKFSRGLKPRVFPSLHEDYYNRLRVSCNGQVVVTVREQLVYATEEFMESTNRELVRVGSAYRIVPSPHSTLEFEHNPTALECPDLAVVGHMGMKTLIEGRMYWKGTARNPHDKKPTLRYKFDDCGFQSRLIMGDVSDDYLLHLRVQQPPPPDAIDENLKKHMLYSLGSQTAELSMMPRKGSDMLPLLKKYATNQLCPGVAIPSRINLAFEALTSCFQQASPADQCLNEYNSYVSLEVGQAYRLGFMALGAEGGKHHYAAPIARVVSRAHEANPCPRTVYDFITFELDHGYGRWYFNMYENVEGRGFYDYFTSDDSYNDHFLGSNPRNTIVYRVQPLHSKVSVPPHTPPQQHHVPPHTPPQHHVPPPVHRAKRTLGHNRPPTVRI